MPVPKVLRRLAAIRQDLDALFDEVVCQERYRDWQNGRTWTEEDIAEIGEIYGRDGGADHIYRLIGDMFMKRHSSGQLERERASVLVDSVTV